MCAERLDKEKVKALSLQIKEGKLFLDGMRLYGVEKYEIKMSSDLPMGKAELEVKLIVSYHENEIG